MDPAVLSTKLASGLVAPLVRRLLVRDGPGAGLVDRPVRISALVSFRGEKRQLTEKDVRRLAERLVAQALESPGEAPCAQDEATALADALTRRLLALGHLDMDDVQAVRLGPGELARQLHRLSPTPDHLSADATCFLDSLTEWSCVHVLHFFTQRSTFVARTLVEQSRGQAELAARLEELMTRTPRTGSRDTAFERRYLAHMAEKHNHITIYGIDLRDSPDRWPLEVAYLSLEATADEGWAAGTYGEPPRHPATVQLPAENALLDHERVLLRGDAGSGKTTLVQWLAVTAARQSPPVRIPFVLPLRTVTRAATLPSPDQFLTAVSCPFSAPAGWAERVLTDGRGLVMVDGIDEVPEQERARTRQWLFDLAHAFPDNQWLVTSRPTAIRSDWLSELGFHELTLTPMTRADVTRFVHRWHRAAAAEEYEAPLLAALRTKQDLAGLATNPLLCALICALHRERRGFLPQGRKELYDAALSMLLARRDRERGMGTPDAVDLPEQAKYELLQRIAYALILSGRTEMDQDAARGIVERALPSIATASGQGEADKIFRHLLLRSGLLRRPAPDVVDFIHRTFQDYLGARAAVEEGHIDVLVSHADDSQWEDVIRMATAHARPNERADLLRKLLAEDTPRRNLLALACLEHAIALDPAVRAEVDARTKHLIPPNSREEAEALAKVGPFVLELLPRTAEGLTDAGALGVTRTASTLGTDGALDVLKGFRNHSDLRVRSRLVGAWGQFDPEEYVTEVLAHLDTTELFITVRDPRQLAALAGMGRTPWLRFNGIHDTARIVEAVSRNAATHVVLYGNPQLRDLGPFADLPLLTYLALEDCEQATDLTPLATSALTELHLSGRHHWDGLTGLHRLSGLRQLGISGETGWGVDLHSLLPLQAPLEGLFLSRGAVRSRGLRGVGRWPGLRALSLGPDAGTLRQGDWGDVADLAALAQLYLHRSMLQAVHHAPPLPQVEVLRLGQLRWEDELAHLPVWFPGVRELSITPAPGTSLVLDDYVELFPDARVSVETPD
ncbi:NACHT domain-containing protein [Streptomyces sp. uw30]|uniref:NACHT domain-containing protein n=1 Tax=Streptomyces sp. uw30 TaxID=1828179 RepID=UPI0011CE1EFA|nr:NACHT domain-containing protein [Streptomyces sp. uw30]TXS50400.1 NACHT domain-containing protein [Streptomyces sp. uw30]